MTNQAAATAEVEAAPVPAPVDASPEPNSSSKEEPKKPAATKTAAPKQAAAPSRTIRVDIERLDVLMNLFSELLIDRSRLEQLASETGNNDLSDTVAHLSRVSTDLQNIVLKLRMVPVDTVFNRFPRMIRDLAKTLDKKIDLVITGAETELDRTVIDEIGDPLVHLLRNAVDHGVESIAERVAAGKPELGTVNLRAFHSGNHVFIEIEDDGSEEYGIEVDKVQTIERMMPITRVPKTFSFVKGVINLRGVVIPVIDLRGRFSLPETEYTDQTRIVIVGVDDMQVGFIVDSANDVIDIKRDAIDSPPEVVGGVKARYLRGVAKLEDTRLLIMLNLNEVLNKSEIVQLESIEG
ncbi:hypothetical protein G195_000641 [Phytophthora kernoviae 00238/432]|uniref:histidine kinase n=1 Tax=Phytophthora kernoviae 00238/432 TaxID=1284355 RepID=A0A8J4SDF1_9STRA|nr:hypothetical protein G195_000641 [Phytophthora kernoviae 00238/432]